MREQVIQVVGRHIEAVRHNDASALPLHPDAVCEFPTNVYRGAASFRKRLDDFAWKRYAGRGLVISSEENGANDKSSAPQT